MSLFFGSAASSGTALPLDAVTGATVAYCLRKLNSAYTGFAFNARRSSDSATTDVGFSQGYVNGNSPVSAGGTFATWAGADTIFCVTLYDQSGNGLNATQANTALQMTYSAAANGIYGCFLGTGTQYYQTSAITQLSGVGSISFFFYGKTTNGTTGTNTLLEGGSGGLSGLFITSVNNARFVIRSPYSSTGGDNCQSSNGVIPTNTFYKFTAIKNIATTNQQVFINGVVKQTVNPTTQPAWAAATMVLTLAANGGFLAGGSYPGNIYSWILYPKAVTADQQKTIEGFFS